MHGVEDRNAALDEAADDAEATEIVLNNYLEYVPLPQLTEFLAHVVAKLRHGGTLVITGTDAYAVAKDYVHYELSIEDFNILLHGNQDDEQNVKVATLTVHGLVNFLTRDFGLDVVRQSLEDYVYIIEVTRP
jgi:hypothetical protein